MVAVQKIRTQDTFVIFLLLLEPENGEPVETLEKKVENSLELGRYSKAFEWRGFFYDDVILVL